MKIGVDKSNKSKVINRDALSLKNIFSVNRIAGALCLFMSLYHLFCAYFGQPEELVFRTTFLAFTMVLCFMLNPIGGQLWKGKINIIFITNLLFIIFPLITQIYILHDVKSWYLRMGSPTTADIIFGSMFILILLEAARRTIGWPIVIVAIFFLFHARFANLVKLGFFYGPPMAWRTLVNFMWMEDAGIYGLPISVTAGVVTLFLIFSSLLQKQNIVTIMMNISYALTGHSVGGAAKAAVVGSGFMGMISGSSVANVATTGCVTIPLMKKLGYSSDYAGGVEAAASNGGQIMPPVMGATAFIIAEFIGISYLKLAIYALVPAVFYYVAIFMFVHYESLTNSNIRTIPKAALPNFWVEIKQSGLIFIPIVVLVIYLIQGYSIQRSISTVILLTFIVSFLKTRTRLNPKSLLEALEDAPKDFVTIAMACGTAGIISGSIRASGLAWRLSSGIFYASGGLLGVSLFLCMIICLILGMGMTTTPVYLIVAGIAIPPLIKAGVPVISAHLFAFYFGVTSSITPPVAVASYAGASIAKGDFFKTSIVGFKLGIVAFVIPYVFSIYPSLLLTYGTFFKLFLTLISTAALFYCLITSLIGYGSRQLNLIERIIIFIFPFFLFFYLDITKPIQTLIYIFIFILIIAYQKFFPYFNKIDKFFNVKTKATIQNMKKDKIDGATKPMKESIDDITTIAYIDNDSFQKQSVSKKGLFIGWGVWSIIILSLMFFAKSHFMVLHYNYFIVILFIISYIGKLLIDIIL